MPRWVSQAKSCSIRADEFKVTIMKRLGSLNFDLLKSKVVLIVTGSVIVLLLVWWLAWMTPEGSKLVPFNSRWPPTRRTCRS